MRSRFRDHAKYHWDNVMKSMYNLTMRVLTAMSFIMLFVNFGYIVYYQFVCYDISKVITGCIALCVMIHLNKSL